jgi:Flp pilus assembly protein TadB
MIRSTATLVESSWVQIALSVDTLAHRKLSTVISVVLRQEHQMAVRMALAVAKAEEEAFKRTMADARDREMRLEADARWAKERKTREAEAKRRSERPEWRKHLAKYYVLYVCGGMILFFVIVVGMLLSGAGI